MKSNYLKHGILLVNQCKRNNIISTSYELTYKLLLSLFPFLIFAISLIGFFEFDAVGWLESLRSGLPNEIVDVIEKFAKETILNKNIDILSTSLLIALYSASSGFFSLIKSLNRAYNVKEYRNFLHLRLMSVILVIILTISIILSMALLVFGDKIWNGLLRYRLVSENLSFLYGVIQYFFTMILLTLIVLIIYKFSVGIRLPLKKLLPGSLLTVFLWILVSRLFSIYINNYSKYSVVYGFIGSFFILMIWLNIISLSLLLGGEFNAFLMNVAREK